MTRRQFLPVGLSAAVMCTAPATALTLAVAYLGFLFGVGVRTFRVVGGF